MRLESTALEKIVVCAFWETHMGEMGVGFDGLVSC